jgi:uncharacterized protein YdeI (YjbR/CyaY-like superfamily)
MVEKFSDSQQLYCKTVEQWREWLEHHHSTESVVWLVFYKKGLSDQTFDYDGALDEALCYGWVDSVIKKLDEQRYARKFTPRKETSQWSEINKRRVEQLIAAGRMTAAGMALIEAAEANGQWNKVFGPPKMGNEVPVELQSALEQNATALKNFQRLAPSFRKRYILWIVMAKRPETRAQRVREAVSLLEKGEKLGLR